MGELLKIENRKPGDLVQRGVSPQEVNLSGAADKAVVIYKASTNQHESRVLAAADIPALTSDKITDLVSAWTAFTPTITSGSGTLTSVSATGSYKLLGKIFMFHVAIVLTTNGTGATDLRFTLPASLVSAADQPMFGREYSATGKMIQAIITSATSVVLMRNYDNTYPGADGAKITLGGTLEVT